MIILDTNVLSESVKPFPSAAVLRWLALRHPSEVSITAITQAEMLYGIELLPAGKRRMSLEKALQRILATEFLGRILPFDEESARLFPKIVAHRIAMGRPISQFDAMIAAICWARRASLATRNVADFEHCGISIMNPWNE